MIVKSTDQEGLALMSAQRRIYTVGQRVEVHGFEGHILSEYLPGMWEVRLERGDICTSWDDIYPMAQDQPNDSLARDFEHDRQDIARHVEREG